MPIIVCHLYIRRNACDSTAWTHIIQHTPLTWHWKFSPAYFSSQNDETLVPVRNSKNRKVTHLQSSRMTEIIFSMSRPLWLWETLQNKRRWYRPDSLLSLFLDSSSFVAAKQKEVDGTPLCECVRAPVSTLQIHSRSITCRRTRQIHFDDFFFWSWPWI